MAHSTQTRQSEDSQTHWPKTSEEMGVVRDQLERMLRDPLFSQSRRYPRLLRRIVEDSLAGKFDSLKERILGIELFDRPSDYDTNADAIVRVTAAEIRKRIALYYHEKEHYSEPRIDLPVGGYVAEFALAPPEIESTPELRVDGAAEHGPEAKELSGEPHKNRKAWYRTLGVAAAVAAVLCVAFGMRIWFGSKDLVDQFWQPFLGNGVRPLLCVGQLPINAMPQGPQGSLGRSLLEERPVSISDAVVVSNYATYLGTKNVRPRIQVSTATTYTDLRQHPILLVGGLDNSWTMRFLGELRYRMRSDPNSGVVHIFDSSSPAGSDWSLDFTKASEHISDDYAIVARFYAPTTESTVIIAAGLGENGTAAANDFLLHAQYLKEIAPESSTPWKNKNMELVLKTQIIDGNAGPPVIVARYFW